MQYQNDLIKRLERAQRIIRARESGDEEAARTEAAVANEILGSNAVSSEQRPFPLAEQVGAALEKSLSKIAQATGKKAPAAGTYDPLFATEQTFREVWELRQVIDHLGIPYAFYMDAAADCLVEADKPRMPRASQYAKNPVIGYAVRKWMQEKAAAYNHGDKLRDLGSV